MRQATAARRYDVFDEDRYFEPGGRSLVAPMHGIVLRQDGEIGEVVDKLQTLFWIGQKRPLRQRDIHAIRTRLQIAQNVRETAMFDPALDSKLRGSDLLGLHVRDIWQGNHVLSRTSVTMKKTGCNVRFEITPDTRKEVTAWIEQEHPRRHRSWSATRSSATARPAPT